MTKVIYIVCGESGQYDEAKEWVLGAFVSSVKAF